MGREEESSSWAAELGIAWQLWCIQQELGKNPPTKDCSTASGHGASGKEKIMHSSFSYDVFSLKPAANKIWIIRIVFPRENPLQVFLQGRRL